MMKGIPTEEHLSRLYFELRRLGASCVGEDNVWPYMPQNREELFCLACDMSRYDPRLITVLVGFLSARWSAFNPVQIRNLFSNMQTPQTVAVVTEFILNLVSTESEKRFFCRYLQMGLDPVPLQYYFHHLYVPGGYLAERAVESSLAEYKKWGFLATEAPVVDEKDRKTAGTFDFASRTNLLRNLLSKKTEICLSDYLSTVEKSISRQQALTDLKSLPWVKMKGRGKGARWLLKDKLN